MKKAIYIFLFLPITLLFSACENADGSENNHSTTNKPTFFDLKNYFKTEIARLATAPHRIEKYAQVNNKQETQTSEIKDWTAELAPFSNSDISRPAWRNKYHVDTVFQANTQGKIVTYTANSKDLKTQRLSIALDSAGVITQISINNQEDSWLSQAHQLLVYEATKGYSIEARQKIIASAADSVTVRARFVH